jgi:hypothetical protein
MNHPRHDGLDAPPPNLSAAVTGAHRRTLDALFRHPLAHNLSWRDVVALFSAIGEADEKPNGEVVFSVGGERLAMKTPHHKDLTAPEVMDLRHFLTRAGWSPTPSAPSKADAGALGQSLIVVIDHAGAKIYRIDWSVDDGRGAGAHDPRHLLHHLERKARDADRDETYPRDERFFEQVADSLSGGGEIVVIGHGKGQSNEADHLAAYLQAHHKLTYARIVREIVADLPHLTTPELLDLGRHAFGRR